MNTDTEQPLSSEEELPRETRPRLVDEDLPAAAPDNRAAVEPDPEAVRQKMQQYLTRYNVTDKFARSSWYCAGQMGLNVIQQLFTVIDPNSRNHARIFGMNTDAGQMVGIFEAAARGNSDFARWLDLNDEKRFQIIQLGTGKGAGGRPKVAGELFDQHSPDIEKTMDGIDMATIIGGSGGGTASGVMPKLAQLLQKAKVGALGITAMPFGYEGEEKYARAEEARKNLSQYCPVITIYNQALFELSGRPEFAKLVAELEEGNFDDNIRRINENIIAPIIRTVDQLIYAVKAILRKDAADWQRMLEGKKAAYGKTYDFESRESVLDNLEHILTVLLDDPFQPGVVQLSDVCMVLLQGAFSKDEVEALMEGVKECMKGGNPEKKVEIMQSYNQESSTKSISVLAVSPELPDAKKSSAAGSPRSARRKTSEALSETGISAVKNSKAEALNPFNHLTLDDLRSLPPARMRLTTLRFEGQAEPVAVYLHPKIIELLQSFEQNWTIWPEAEMEKNGKLLAEYFHGLHPETQGKKWLPEGLTKAASADSKVSPEQRKRLMDSFVPPNMYKSKPN